jgi:hypothetical protein
MLILINIIYKLKNADTLSHSDLYEVIEELKKNKLDLQIQLVNLDELEDENEIEDINEKIDDIKHSVRDNHDDLKIQLKTMYDASCTQHAQLSEDIRGIKRLHDNALVIAAVIGPILTFLATLIDWHQVFNNAIK